MEEHKKLEDFIKKSVKEIGYDSPTVDFTDKVLAKVRAKAETKTETLPEYRPVLSKKAWAAILALVAIVSGLVIFNDTGLNNGWLSRLDTLFAFDWSIPIPHISISNTLLYGLLIGTFFVLVQVLMIKQFLDRRYQLP